MNYKLVISIFSAATIFAGTVQAGYECASLNKGSQLSVQEANLPCYGKGEGLHIILTNEIGQTEFCGHVTETSDGLYMSKTTIQLVEIKSLSSATLVVTKKPKSCGRGSCDAEFENIISAYLDFANSQSYFYCNENNI